MHDCEFDAIYYSTLHIDRRAYSRFTAHCIHAYSDHGVSSNINATYYNFESILNNS